MTKLEIILIGAGGHARACIDVIEAQGQYQIAGLIGVVQELNTQQLGYTVIATDDDLPTLINQYQYALVCIGQIKTADIRRASYRHLVELGFKLPSIISPRAYVSPHAVIGAGTIVMHGAVVNAGASVGENCIVNSNSLIEHDAVIMNHCHIATGAIVNGHAEVASGSLVGSGSVVKQSIKLGKNCIIGMGLAVRHDVPENSQFMGKR